MKVVVNRTYIEKYVFFKWRLNSLTESRLFITNFLYPHSMFTSNWPSTTSNFLRFNAIQSFWLVSPIVGHLIYNKKLFETKNGYLHWWWLLLLKTWSYSVLDLAILLTEAIFNQTVHQSRAVRWSPVLSPVTKSKCRL